MKKVLFSNISNRRLYTLGAIVSLVILGSFAAYRYWLLSDENTLQQQNLKSTEQFIALIEKELAEAKDQNNQLGTQLNGSKEEAATAEQEVAKSNETINTLQKLTSTDPELLKKYSKVYFLNENYTPPRLIDIPSIYLYEKNKSLQFHEDAWPYLEKMLNAARIANAPMQIASAYRSFGTQAALKSSYRVVYGAGTANQFSADQGYSEHQLGTAVDLTASSTVPFSAFEKTTAYNWLNDNAYQYGFVLSYPKDNKYYVFEPWHWRFVGVALAQKLHDENKQFYDLDQREIDRYLINIFD